MNEVTPKKSGCGKWAAGCGVVMVVLLIAGGVGAYFTYQTATGVYKSAKRLSDLVMIENEIVNQSAYTAPSDGLMSLEQVEQFVYVQTEIRSAIGPSFTDLVDDLRGLMTEVEDANNLGRIGKVIGLAGKLVDPLTKAKTAQVAALNNVGMSLREYRWLQAETKAALGIPPNLFDLEAVLGAILSQEEIGESQPEPVAVSNPANRRLVEPHADLLMETLVLSGFGL